MSYSEDVNQGQAGWGTERTGFWPYSYSWNRVCIFLKKWCKNYYFRIILDYNVFLVFKSKFKSKNLKIRSSIRKIIRFESFLFIRHSSDRPRTRAINEHLSKVRWNCQILNVREGLKSDFGLHQNDNNHFSFDIDRFQWSSNLPII